MERMQYSGKIFPSITLIFSKGKREREYYRVVALTARSEP
jgi:hypothetical protein